MSIRGKYDEIIRIMTSIDVITNELTSKRISSFFFGLKISSDFTCAEAAYLRIVSWLYILLFEDFSSNNINFITQKFEFYGISIDQFNNFKKLIHSSRTILQHSIDLKKSTDLEKIREYEYWLRNEVNRIEDLNDKDWEKCCIYLLLEFSFILESIQKILSEIQMNKEFLNIVIQDWINYNMNSLSYNTYENVVLKVLTNLDLEFVPVESFLRKNHDKWQTEIRNSKGKDVKIILQRMVERDVLYALETYTIPLPLSGNDIMEHFELKPGPKVREYLQQAMQIFIKNPCSKDSLLSLLEKKQE